MTVTGAKAIAARVQAPLSVASCMADNAAVFAREVAQYLGDAFGCDVNFVDSVPWRERERRLYAGDIQLCWICGLPYVRQSALSDPRIEPLAAPVMAAARYGGQAVYFSDVVVRADVAASGLHALAGTRVAYNEPNSHSGYNVLCHALDAMQAPPGFFDQVIESGAHQISIDMLLTGMADAAVIDSTVLETECVARTDLLRKLRIVTTLGPSPMPPWVVSKTISPRLKAMMLEAILGMHEDRAGRDVLARARIARFEAVTDSWYNPIRSMAVNAARYSLRATHLVARSGSGHTLRPA